jgi:hypothetical protein
MHIDRPCTTWPWAHALPGGMNPEQIRDLHVRSRPPDRTTWRIVTTAVIAALEEAHEAASRAA